MDKGVLIFILFETACLSDQDSRSLQISPPVSGSFKSHSTYQLPIIAQHPLISISHSPTYLEIQTVKPNHIAATLNDSQHRPWIIIVYIELCGGMVALALPNRNWYFFSGLKIPKRVGSSNCANCIVCGVRIMTSTLAARRRSITESFNGRKKRVTFDCCCCFHSDCCCYPYWDYRNHYRCYSCCLCCCYCYCSDPESAWSCFLSLLFLGIS
jgi:hypothetical protein